MFGGGSGGFTNGSYGGGGGGTFSRLSVFTRDSDRQHIHTPLLLCRPTEPTCCRLPSSITPHPPTHAHTHAPTHSIGSCAVFGGREVVFEPGNGSKSGGMSFDQPPGVGMGGAEATEVTNFGAGGACRIIQRVYSRWFQ